MTKEDISLFELNEAFDFHTPARMKKPGLGEGKANVKCSGISREIPGSPAVLSLSS